MPEATVHEALLFSARLRLPKTVPSAQAGKFVEEVRAIGEAAAVPLRGAACSWPWAGAQHSARMRWRAPHGTKATPPLQWRHPCR